MYFVFRFTPISFRLVYFTLIGNMRKKTEKSSSKSRNKCHICNKSVLGGSYNMKSHLYGHNLVQPRFTCSYCSKQYFRKDVFEKHLDTHMGRQKTHLCDHCGRDFVDKRNLVTHLKKIHDDVAVNNKRFSCKACGAGYCEERLLKYHIRKEHFNLHQEESKIDKKPNETWVERVLETKVCVQMTKINNNVISIKKCDPIKMENGPEDLKEKVKFQKYIHSVFASKDKSQYSKAICDYCNKEMLKKSLQSHIRETHLKLKKFKCDKCNRKFNRHYQLVDHTCGQFGRKRIVKKEDLLIDSI